MPLGDIFGTAGKTGQQRQQQQRQGDIELDDQTGDDDGEAEGQGQQTRQLPDAVRESFLQQGEKRLLARLAADPDVRSVLEMKQQGKKFKVLSDDGSGGGSTVQRDSGNQQIQDQDDEVVNLDDLDNRGLTKHILGSVGKILDQKLEGFIKPLKDQTTQLQNYTQQQENQKILNEITKVKEEFDDFEQYRTAMHDLSTRNSDLTVRELYLLAKHRAGGTTNQRAERTDSEYPSTSVSRPGTHTRVKNLQPGQRGISQLLQASLSRRQDEIMAGLDD